MESIRWLENYLLGYNGSVIIVAHDRYFLDRIVTKIIEIENTHVTVFSGNYTAYADKKKILRNMQLNVPKAVKKCWTSWKLSTNRQK